MTTPAPNEANVRKLADELNAARGKGLVNLDHGTPVPLELLEALARVYARPGTGDRVALIERLIREALVDYATPSREEDAEFVHGLFFDQTGRAPVEAGGPTDLMEAVRKPTGVKDRQFRELRTRHFEKFARFLLSFVVDPVRGSSPPASAVAVPPDASTSEPAGCEVVTAAQEEPPVPVRGRRWVLAGVGVVAVVASLVGFVWQPWSSGSHNQTPLGGSVPTSGSVPSGGAGPTASSTSIMFKFDTHGDPPPSVLVYPGPLQTAADRVSHFTFPNGASVKAVCLTIGRTITFTPDQGGTPIVSKQWVRIGAGLPGAQYATLAYGELVPSGAKLSVCTNVS